MANSEGVSGVDSFVLYGEETAYNTEQATVETHLGLIKSFTPKITNNNAYTRGFVGTTSGGRNVAKVIPGTVDHDISVDMEVINWAFLEYVLGSVAGSDPYTYSEDNTPPSLTIHRCIDNPGTASTDQDSIWTGCVIESCTIKASVGEPVTVSLTMKGAHRELDTTILSKQALGTIPGFSFAGGSIELPNASAMSNIIDSVELTITNDFDMRKGLGSRETQNALARARDYKIKFTVAYLDNDLLTAVQGAAIPTGTTNPTEYVTIELNFAQGVYTAAFLFTTFVFDEMSGKENVNEIIGEDLSGTAFSLAVTETRS